METELTQIEVTKALRDQWQKVKQTTSLADEITEWQKCCALVDLKEKIVAKAIEDAKRYQL